MMKAIGGMKLDEARRYVWQVDRNIVVMGIVSFFTDVASEMIYPILPIFLMTVLGAPVAMIGFLEGITSAGLNALEVVSGWFSDRFRQRKSIAVVGYALSAAAKLIVAISTSWSSAMIGKFLDRMGKGTRTSPRDALIADSTKREERGKAFGLHRAIDNAGAIFGPLLAAFLLYGLKIDMRTIFYAAFIPAVISVLCLVFFVRDVKMKGSTQKLFAFRISELNASFKLFLGINVLFMIGNSADAFMVLKAQNAGMSIASILLLYALLNFAHAMLSFPAGIIADRIGPKRVLLAGYLIFAATFLLFGMAGTGMMLWLLFPLFGLYRGLTEGVGIAYISNLVSPEHVATALGFYQTMIGIAGLAASITAGLLWGALGPSSPFIFGGFVAIVASIVFVLFEKNLSHRPIAVNA